MSRTPERQIIMLSNKILSQMLETAIEAAKLAGCHAMAALGHVKTSIKNGNELVTQADSQCQQIIIDTIAEKFPEHGFLGEEGQHGGIFKQSPTGKDHIWWVIDPIDGTNNFANGIRIFTISIGAFYNGLPVAGVIYDPPTNSMFTALSGGSAQLNGIDISTNETAEINKFSSIGIDSQYDAGVPKWICTILQQTRFRNFGTTALQLAYVANGGLIATIINVPKLWDIAAGVIIAQTAGAIVSDWKGKNLFPINIDDYNGEVLPMLAANKKTHPKILHLISS